MAVPNAPLSGDGEPLLFGMWDDAGTNAGVILRGNFQTSMNGEDAGELRVYPTTGTAARGWKTLSATTATAMTALAYEITGILIKAPQTNAGTIYLSESSGITADDDATTGGWPLEPGESIGWPARALNSVFLRGAIGDKVAFLASVDG